MSQERFGLGEQAINKIAEVAIASQLKQGADVQVQIKTDLNKLGQGQLDSIAITIHQLKTSENLDLEKLHLEFGQVTVKPFSALRGKIKLVHPLKGLLQVVINEAGFAAAVNSESLQRTLRSQAENLTVLPMQCSLLDGAIKISTAVPQFGSESPRQVVLVTTPEIVSEGQEISLRNTHYVEGVEPSSEFTAALLTHLHELLTLKDFVQKGMVLNFQQLSVSAGKLTLNANASVEQFPSS